MSEFEQYLRSFQPRQPDPLVPRRSHLQWMAIAVFAASLVVGFWVRPEVKRFLPGSLPPQFTMEKANTLLASDTAWNQVLDASAFGYKDPAQRGIIEFLSQEKLSQ